MSDAPANGVIKRSISIAGHRTSISLEEPFWEELQLIAALRGISVQRLVGEIDEGRAGENLSSALRVFVLRQVQARATLPPGDVPARGQRVSVGLVALALFQRRAVGDLARLTGEAGGNGGGARRGQFGQQRVEHRCQIGAAL